MHERSIVRALLKQVHSLQVEREAQRVLTVRVSVGAFSGVEPDLVQLAFEDLVDDSPIAGAQLVLRVVPLEALCLSCSHEFAVRDFRFECPHCRQTGVRVTRGEGLQLESVTLEEGDVQRQSA